ncbi:alpha/beta hydrolase [Dactylosporangium sp. NPDC050588]|uniref:alpha/beta hydrolase n=1 Tax=Dactylosporangium sp. NPDC050588 TaxID=3157211 RepID=UPI0033F19604
MLRRLFALPLIAVLWSVFGPTQATDLPPVGVHSARFANGLAVEVVGDPSTAATVVVLVPGVATTATNFDRGLGGVQRRAPAWQARQLATRAADLQQPPSAASPAASDTSSPAASPAGVPLGPSSAAPSTSPPAASSVASPAGSSAAAPAAGSVSPGPSSVASPAGSSAAAPAAGSVPPGPSSVASPAGSSAASPAAGSGSPGSSSVVSPAGSPAASPAAGSGSPGRSAASSGAAASVGRRGGVAVIAWLGYHPPGGIRLDAVREDAAASGADALLRFLRDVDAPRIVLVGHSYGSTVIGLAAARLDAGTGGRVTDIVALGSPGMGVDRAADLRTTARVWAGTAPGDWTRRLPGLRILGAGHGTHPTDPAFGATPLPVDGVTGHDGYFVPGTASLDALAALANGDLDAAARHS